MKSLRLLVAGLIGAATFTVAAPAGPACASTERHAVLVVDAQDSGGQYHYCVELPSDEDVSGIDLIVLAHDQFGLTYRLGYGGNAVCMLADVGTEGDDCFSEYPDFWGYWHGDESGGWTWANEGAAASTVDDGDVEGWSWGSGSDGTSHPTPPETTFESVCEVAAPPPSDDGGGDDGGGQQNGGGSAHRGSHQPTDKHTDRSNHAPHRGPNKKPAPAPSSPAPGQPRHRERHHSSGIISPLEVTSPSPSVNPSPDQRPLAATEDREKSPPIGGIIAVAAALLFAAGAIVLRRRRLQ